MRLLARLLVLTAAITVSGCAQEPSWVGKYVVPKRTGIKISTANERELATLDEPHYEVLHEQDRQICVRTRQGHVGWFPKADAIPLENAVAFFTERIRQSPLEAALYDRRGCACRTKSEFGNALRDFDEAIRLGPQAGYLINRGTVWCDLKGYDKAIADFSEALRLNPTYQLAYSYRGFAWREKGDYDKAIEDYSEALRLDPKDAHAFHGRGWLWERKKDLDKAIADYDEAIRLDPSASAYHNRGLAWGAKGERDKAIADLSKAVELDPKRARVYGDRGYQWSRKKENDKAIADYTENINRAATDLYAYQGRGWVWMAKKDYDKAIADYDEILKFDPKFLHAYSLRGRAQYLAKRYDDALASWQEALKIDPDYSWATMRWAHFLATCPDDKYRDGKRALDLANKALKLEKNPDSEFHEMLAAVFADADNFEEAVRWQEQALQDPLIRDDVNATRRLELYRNKQPYRQD
jgi:tetratricopeptide (TPR) repeat protein